MKRITKSVACLLACCMVIGLAACGGTSTAYFEGPAAPSTLNLDGAVDLNTETTANEKDELSREELEVIVDVLGEDVDTDKLTDAELSNLADDLLNSLENDEESGAVDLSANKDAYDENGAMTRPFDEVYPELIENGSVEFDDETILIKLSNKQGGKITAAMAKAGVVKLESIVPLEEETWYKANLKAGTDASVALEEIRVLKDVILAEYDYIIKTAEIDCYKDFDDSHNFDKNKHKKDQWYMHHCGIPDGYSDMTADGGSASVIVAVIDTGVDVDHEDLKDNIWKNTAETPDNGIDDDGNGYIDDYYGVNIVAGKGNGDDDNGHGTHVAGIIAAQNNNLGTVGIAYNTTIMPVKAAMASGYLHDSDIAKAVLYAYEHGAEVINMSFGGTSCSIAVQDALATAYTRCVLVASAGNNGKCNEGIGAVPNYPAALTYVLGVMAVDKNGTETYFTNWDLVSFSGSEYELYAPGYDIMSTLPDDRYGSLSGTSMAAPMVSAMAAILRSEFTDRDTYPTKFIYGQLSATSDHYATCNGSHGTHNLPQIVNLHSALTKLPNPDVGVQDYTLFDTQGLSEDVAGANNGDGVIDAGETIALGFTLRNRWSISKNTIVTIDTKSNAGISDPYITIVNPSINYGSVGSYSTADCGKIYTDELHTGWENPFIIKIAENCPNDYIVKVNVHLQCENGLDGADDTLYTNEEEPVTFLLTVRNGVVLPSVINEDMTLTPDNLYIIPGSTVIEEDVTVRVLPGTNIQFWTNDPEDAYADNYIAYLSVKGEFLVEGTKDAPVKLYPSDLMSKYNVDFSTKDNGYISLKYADVTNYMKKNTSGSISYANRCTFRMNYGDPIYCRYISSGKLVNSYSASKSYNFGLAENSVLYKLAGTNSIKGSFNRCIFADSAIYISGTANDKYHVQNCVFLGNVFYDQTKPNVYNGSSMTPLTYTVNDTSDFHVTYWKETGTTYIRAHNEINYQALQQLGGSYLVINDEAEAEFVKNNIKGALNHVGAYYDVTKEAFVWSDGSIIDPSFDTNGVLIPKNKGSQFTLHTENSIYFVARNTAYYHIYEIPGQILPAEITFKDYEITLDKNLTYQIEARSMPVQLGLEDFIYESQNEEVVKVNSTGLVTPVGNGTADVYVYSTDRAVCNYITFNVSDYVALESLKLKCEKTDIAIGETVKSWTSFEPANTSRKLVKLTSSNPDVLAIDKDDNFVGISSGTAVVTANCDGVLSAVTVRVFNKATALEFETPAIVASIYDESVTLPKVIASEGAELELVWRVLDTSVAEISDEKLLLKAVGVTTLEITDVNSGLKNECTIAVRDEETSNIKDYQYSSSQGSYNYVLFENGDLYRWAGTADPVLLLQNVDLFSSYTSTFIAAFKDGSVKSYSYNAYNSNNPLTEIGTYPFFEGKPIKQLAHYTGQYVVVLENGLAYAWGTNTRGQLGVGGYDTVTEPTLVNLEANIMYATTSNYTTYFLDENGDLYYAGCSKTDIPIYVTSNIKSHLGDMGWLSKDHVVMNIDAPNSSTLAPNITIRCNDPILREYETIFTPNYNYYWGIKDGALYAINFSNVAQVRKYPNLNNITTVFNGNYAIANDNALIKLDFTNLTTTFTPVKSIDDDIRLEKFEQIGNKFKLTFNKKILSDAIRLYADGTQITLTHTIQNLNEIVIERNDGFEEGVAYQLVFDAGQISSVCGITNKSDIIVDFTYTAETELPEEDAAEEAPEKVVNASVLDGSVERILTYDSFHAKINEIQAVNQNNDYFHDNVILNRISTDTNVSHWFKVQAPSTAGAEIPLGNNYWGTTNETAIGLQIVDYVDFIKYGHIMYAPFLTEAPEDTFPFVTSVKIFNKYGEEVTTIGNEQITVRVTFNRDMDTSIPLQVRFGSAYPYGDYEIEGEYVDARTWEGSYKLTTIIENGIQYFTIENGCSATDDLELMRDRARFSFEIDTTAAQALIMQGEATDTGIKLTWTQDDFDTLMGYNVYRSTTKDGLYTRVNTSVIPADTMEFFDDTVEPGVLYYYNFTVVQTDLSESIPSGKIVIMSKDTMAPNIYHSPVYNATTGANLLISATVTDNLHITYARVYYRVKGTDEWNVAVMNHLNDKFSAIIVADYVTVAGLEYYIEAYDGVSYTYKGTAETPYTIAVQEAVSVDAMGDINGDGVITNIDALMLLKAINDQLNLTAEQFACADLDGNGKLAAKEALRVLQYVSGAVGSVDMRS